MQHKIRTITDKVAIISKKEWLFYTAFFGAVLAFAFFLPTDFDYWWHIKTGEYIIAHHQVPLYDIYSYTLLHGRWIAHEWLSEVLLACINNIAGYIGNVLFYGILLCITFLFIFLYLSKKVVSAWIQISIATIGIIMMLPIYGVRMQMITTFFFSLLIYMLLAYMHDKKWPVIMLPIVFLLWANMHGGWIITLLPISICIILLCIQKHIPDGLILLGVFAIGVLLFVIANPNHITAFLYPFRYFTAFGAFTGYIAEWQHPVLHSLPIVVFFLSIVPVIYLAIRQKKDNRYVFLLLLTGSLYLLAWDAARNIVLYAISYCYLFSFQIAIEHFAIPRLPFQQMMRIAFALLIVFSIIGTLYIVRQPLVFQHTWQANPSGYPVAEVQYLTNHPTPRILNSYGDGGYLIYHTIPVFIDGRADVYSGKLFSDYVIMATGRPGWQKVFASYNFNAVLIQKQSFLGKALQNNTSFVIASESKYEVLYIRKRIIAS